MICIKTKTFILYLLISQLLLYIYHWTANKIIMNILHRRNRHHRLIDALNPDKGKRHYWGNLNGDYGFMESADRK